MSTKPKRHSLDEAKEIIQKGYPAVEPILPYLVAWLSNTNSSGYSEIANFLLSIGDPVVPHVKKALQETEKDYSGIGEWHSSLLFTQARHWPKEMVLEIEEELDDLTDNGDMRWNVHIDAARIMITHGLGDMKTLSWQIQQWKRVSLENLKELEELENALEKAD